MLKRSLMAEVIFIFIFFLLSVTIFYTFSKNAEAKSSKSASILDGNFTALNKSLGNANWQELKKTLREIIPQDTKTCNVEAPLRFLYGHSALATGENSVAVKQFYCASDKSGSKTLMDWLDWSKKLATHEEHSKWTISHYLYGDALARSGELKAAKKELDKALGIDPNNFLALNARGVVNWLLYEADPSNPNIKYDTKAADDFIKVYRIKPKFADAFVNRGLINLRAQGVMDQSDRYFRAARKIDPAYWLAANGQAVIYGAKGDYAAFQKLISKIEKEAPDTPFLAINSGHLAFNSDNAKGNRGAATLAQNSFRIAGDGVNNALNYIAERNPRMELGIKNVGLSFGCADLLRGGIFLYIKEGENLVVTKDGSPRQAGTWFALNYPLEREKIDNKKE